MFKKDTVFDNNFFIQGDAYYIKGSISRKHFGVDTVDGYFLLYKYVSNELYFINSITQEFTVSMEKHYEKLENKKLIIKKLEVNNG